STASRLRYHQVIPLEVEPRDIAEDERTRVGETARVVTHGTEVVGAGHERAAAPERTHATVGEVETGGVCLRGRKKEEGQQRGGDSSPRLRTHQRTVPCLMIS